VFKITNSEDSHSVYLTISVEHSDRYIMIFIFKKNNLLTKDVKQDVRQGRGFEGWVFSIVRWGLQKILLIIHHA